MEIMSETYTEGVVDDGAAILKDGAMMKIGKVLEELNAGVDASAEVARLSSVLREIESRAYSIYQMTGSEEVAHEAIVVRDMARSGRKAPR
jgi:hypothetical protein